MYVLNHEVRQHRLLTFGLAVTAAILLSHSAAIAQPGSGNCQRGGGGSGGPPAGMMGPNGMMSPNGFNPQAAGFMPGYPPSDIQRNGPAGQSPAQMKQILQASNQAKMDSLREKKAAIRAANLSRQKSKTVKPPSSSPTALNQSAAENPTIL